MEHDALKSAYVAVVFNPVLHRLLTFPSECPDANEPPSLPEHSFLVAVPVIAAVNGHCFAGGMALAMACDYRVMTDGSKRNAWMCMNEVRQPQWLIYESIMHSSPCGGDRSISELSFPPHW